MLIAKLQIKRMLPKSLVNGADFLGIAACDDGMEYVIKDRSSHLTTPHNEWFCSCLAASVGIAVPPFAQVELPTGEYAFGSRWEGGVAAEDWRVLLANNKIKIDEFASTLSKIWAFDHFVFNPDRHFSNYIVRNLTNTYGMLAIDFSRAWLDSGFPPGDLPFKDKDNTMMCARMITSVFGKYLMQNEIDKTLNSISKVHEARVSDIINSHPKNWVTDTQRDAILSWWNSSRDQRLDLIRQGFTDGSYL